MTYKDAWEIIQFKHCEDTCDFGQMEDCQGEKCEYYMALKALNAQYYAEGNVWAKPKDEPQTVLEAVRKMGESVRKAIKDEPQTERSSE